MFLILFRRFVYHSKLETSCDLPHAKRKKEWKCYFRFLCVLKGPLLRNTPSKWPSFQFLLEKKFLVILFYIIWPLIAGAAYLCSC